MNAPRPFTPLSALSIVGLDLETTGLDAKTARVVQIGAVRVVDCAVDRDQGFDTLVDPGLPIPAASTEVHGIRDSDVAGAPAVKDALPRLAAFLGDSVVVGHTIGYDLEILRREAERSGISWETPVALDIRILARTVLHGMAGYDLDALCASLGIEIQGRHTAYGDALAAAEVFSALLPKLRERGIRTLEEAQVVSRRVRNVETAGVPDADYSGRLELDAPERIDSYPYRHTVSAVMSSPPAVLSAECSLRDALAKLIDDGVSSVFVEDNGAVSGIITERDILRAIRVHGVDALERQLSGFRSSPVATVGADDLIYRAIGRMDRMGIRHLGVTGEGGKIVGAVTTRNLLRHRASTAMILGDEIAGGDSVAALAAAWGKVPAMAEMLAAEAVDARMTAAVISAEIQMLTRRAAEIGEQRLRVAGLGDPPVRYALMVLGSAGRGESLLAADQDNAIVYEAAGEEEAAADLYFARLGKEIADALDTVGIPYCQGGVMAREAAWRKSCDRWRQTVDGWIGRQRPEDLLNVDIFFDAVVVHGDRALGEELLEYARERAGRNRPFRVALSRTTGAWQMPFSLFGGWRTGADGRVDLKSGGLMPIYSVARILALKAGSPARSTQDRLQAAISAGLGAETQLSDILEAHGVILDVVLRQQIADVREGIGPGNRVLMASLPKSRRATLREALRQVPGAIDIAREGTA